MPFSEALAEDPIRTLLEERERLKREHLAGLSGLDLVRSLSNVTDVAVTGLWADVGGRDSGVSLVALGGYGRRELSPHSDLDLMILHEGPAPGAEVARDLFYRLWDAGFDVGHSVRSIRECLRLSRANFEAQTSFLDARYLGGDAALFEQLAVATLRETRKRPRDFIDRLRSAREARVAKFERASASLEPNLKEGSGGLRDVQAVAWLGRVTDAEPVADPERSAHAELLHRVRNHLHYISGRHQDVLWMQDQEAAAVALGWADADGWSGWDVFMRDVHRALRITEHATVAAFARVDRDPRLSRRRQRSDVDRLSVTRGAVPPRDGFGAWTDETRRAFFDLLRTGDPEALETFDLTGDLTRYLPEWESVRFRSQHNSFHRFTIDVHCYQTVAQLVRLPERGDEPIAARATADVRDRDLLLLAGLLHDIGKGQPGDHAEAGEAVAGAVASRMGLDPHRSRVLAWLVRNHLLLVDVATKRDTTDEDVVVEAAARVGDPERLRMLYALSVADGLATGPAGWTPWTSALAAELFTRMAHVLEGGELASIDATELVRVRTAEVKAGLDRHAPEAVTEHLAGMSRRYVLAFPTEALIRHFALMADPLPAGAIRAHVAPTGQPGLSELTVVAPDRPGLFSVVSGALALHGINVMSAQIFTRSDGAALEVFRVTSAFDTVIDQPRWERVFDDIRAGLRDEQRVPARLVEKRRAYAGRRSRLRQRGPVVTVDNEASDFFTVIDVQAPDRIGLLATITSAVTDLGLDIHIAKVATYGEEVADAFYVRDLEGEKVTDASRIGTVQRRIVGAIDDALRDSITGPRTEA